MVIVFLSIVAIGAVVMSYQSSALRRASTRSQYGFEAVEICESAINEAAHDVGFPNVFPTAVFDATVPPQPPSPSPPATPAPPIPSKLGDWMMRIASEDKAGLDSNFPGYNFQFRGVPAAAPPGVFVSMTWPTVTKPTAANNYQGSFAEFDTPTTLAIAQAQPGFKSLSKVKMVPLAWRRDYAGGRWQNWGVVHYSVRAEFDDGRSVAARTMHVDRMFSIYAHFKAAGVDQPGESAAADTDQFLHFVPSHRNLKTVILRR